MVNINRQIMLEGMRADFVKMDELSQRLVERARKAERITCKTPHGTEFEAELSPELEMAEDQRHHHKRQMGQLAGWRNFHRADEY